MYRSYAEGPGGMPETCSRQDSQQLFPRALPSLLPSTKTVEIRIGTQVQPRIVAPCWFFSIHAFLSIFFQFALAGAPCAAGLRFCFLHPNLKFFSTLYSLSFCSGHFFSYFDWYCHLEPMTRYDFQSSQGTTCIYLLRLLLLWARSSTDHCSQK